MLGTMAQKKVEKEQVNIRMSTNLLGKLDRIAGPYGITRTALITQAVVEYVQRHEAQQQQQPRDKRPAR